MKDLIVVGRNPVMDEMTGLVHSTEDLHRYLWVWIFAYLSHLCVSGHQTNVQIRQNDASDDKMQLFTMISFIKRKKAFQTCNV